MGGQWGQRVNGQSQHIGNNLNFFSQDELDVDRGVFNDGRTAHEVFVDSITEQTLDEFESSGCDIMIREVEMFHTPITAPERPKEEYNNSWYTRPSPDIVLVDLDEDLFAAYEVKGPIEKREEAWEELIGFKDDFSEVKHRLGADVELTGHRVLRKHLNDSYKDPSSYPNGFYLGREAREKLEEGPEERAVLNALYGDAFELENAYEVQEFL